MDPFLEAIPSREKSGCKKSEWISFCFGGQISVQGSDEKTTFRRDSERFSAGEVEYDFILTSPRDCGVETRRFGGSWYRLNNVISQVSAGRLRIGL